MKRYRCNKHEDPTIKRRPTRVTGLMGFDESENPILHSNVFAQRTSMYVQYAQPDMQTPRDLVSPYHTVGDIPGEDRYDNGNTVIILENSDSNSIYDTVIEARGEWEARWRRMSFYLPLTSKGEHTDDHEFIGDCMRTITADFFKAVAQSWDDLLDASWEVGVPDPELSLNNVLTISSMCQYLKTKFTIIRPMRVGRPSFGEIRPSGWSMRN